MNRSAKSQKKGLPPAFWVLIFLALLTVMGLLIGLVVESDWFEEAKKKMTESKKATPPVARSKDRKELESPMAPTQEAPKESSLSCQIKEQGRLLGSMESKNFQSPQLVDWRYRSQDKGAQIIVYWRSGWLSLYDLILDNEGKLKPVARTHHGLACWPQEDQTNCPKEVWKDLKQSSLIAYKEGRGVWSTGDTGRNAFGTFYLRPNNQVQLTSFLGLCGQPFSKQTLFGILGQQSLRTWVVALDPQSGWLGLFNGSRLHRGNPKYYPTHAHSLYQLVDGELIPSNCAGIKKMPVNVEDLSTSQTNLGLVGSFDGSPRQVRLWQSFDQDGRTGWKTQKTPSYSGRTKSFGFLQPFGFYTVTGGWLSGKEKIHYSQNVQSPKLQTFESRLHNPQLIAPRTKTPANDLLIAEKKGRLSYSYDLQIRSPQSNPKYLPLGSLSASGLRHPLDQILWDPWPNSQHLIVWGDPSKGIFYRIFTCR